MLDCKSHPFFTLDVLGKKVRLILGEIPAVGVALLQASRGALQFPCRLLSAVVSYCFFCAVFVSLCRAQWLPV